MFSSVNVLHIARETPRLSVYEVKESRANRSFPLDISHENSNFSASCFDSGGAPEMHVLGASYSREMSFSRAYTYGISLVKLHDLSRLALTA